ncbi:hypothetical protein CAEBREN_17309 [Caenorhabditis brenneri]|uniref:Uncharacterized protein n=1 Tax=Caenorhabditis brenneri TaxID=135651 RepID=G0NBX2_CAEBE|nr:hypothetical protein CAEBREN_17309 [Caenorhabditis brenneri]
MMRSVVFFMMLLSNIAASNDKSRLRAYVALYCPLEKHWSYTAEMWESDGDQGDGDSGNDKLTTRTGTGTNQLQVFDIDQEVEDNLKYGSEAEIEIRIEHDCNLQNTKVNLKLWDELKIPLGQGDTYAFKALHLTQPQGN